MRKASMIFLCLTFLLSPIADDIGPNSWTMIGVGAVMAAAELLVIYCGVFDFYRGWGVPSTPSWVGSYRWMMMPLGVQYFVTGLPFAGIVLSAWAGGLLAMIISAYTPIKLGSR